MESRHATTEILGDSPWPNGRLVPTHVHASTTYFVAPPGTTVVAAAGGRVTTVASDHVRIDHGDGLCTVVGSIARVLVDAGAEVARGEPIAVSGDARVKLSVLLDDALVDPFAGAGEVALWLTGNLPQPNDELFDDSIDVELETQPFAPHARSPRLDLPFSAADFDGVVLSDE